MAKKRSGEGKKKSVRIPKKQIEEAMEKEVNKVLVENFVALQKVLVDNSMKFDNLAGQISKLLELFEISAKSIAEKDFDVEKNNKDNKRILEKIDAILEQNKTIARGLTLMNEKIEETITTTEIIEPLPLMFQNQAPRNMPPSSMRNLMPPKPILKSNESGMDEYKKSISSKNP